MSNTSFCSRCGKVKDIIEFETMKKGGYRKTCKACNVLQSNKRKVEVLFNSWTQFIGHIRNWKHEVSGNGLVCSSLTTHY